jgi:predicted histone-like DNA-binding protein
MGEIRYDIFRTPSQTNGQKHYYVKMLKPQVLEFDDVKENLNLSSSVTPSDVSAVVEGISGLLVSQLTRGNRVHINGIGYFSLSVTAPAFDDKKDFDAEDIQIKGVNFRPDVALIKMLRKEKLHFRRNSASHRKKMDRQDLLQLLESFFMDNESMSSREFIIITRLPHTSALRLLRQLCEGPEPILKHIGPRNASVYVATKYAPWNL